MFAILVSFIIITIVIILFVLSTSKGYSYKHTVDPIDENLHTNHNQNEPEKDAVEK
ncbi:YtzI protein [Bacillus sp. FJAT-29790]|uniref:YtzI protein n=1 Tax=Bacillus sp. FJAT-29790 TaxID=1895002 RepID=UPI001C22DAC8|nr:YtzI protein [Bacillus sp. FJAT-29790]MBU8879855.1 YtzI protein [Bacillus sp. FJAT-29790]